MVVSSSLLVAAAVVAIRAVVVDNRDTIAADTVVVLDSMNRVVA